MAKLWDLDGKLRASLDGHVFGVRFLSFLPDGSYGDYQTQHAKGGTSLVPSAGSDDACRLLTLDGHTTFRTWNTEGRLLGRWQPPEARRPIAFQVDSDGGGWAYADLSWQFGSVCLALSADGQTAACRGNPERGPRRRLRLLDLASGKRKGLKPKSDIKHAGRIDTAAFSPDGKTLVTAEYQQGGRIIVWDLPERTGRKVLDEKAAWVSCMAFSPDGETLATTSHDAVRLWDVGE